MAIQHSRSANLLARLVWRGHPPSDLFQEGERSMNDLPIAERRVKCPPADGARSCSNCMLYHGPVNEPAFQDDPLEATFVPVNAGNRRSQKRKMARMLGESGSRQRGHKNTSKAVPYLSPEYHVQVEHNGTIRLVYRPTKRAIPECERPSRVKRIRP